jgi:hypothetical protein
MEPELYLLNISDENWEACDKDKIFGLRPGSVHYGLKKGDLLTCTPETGPFAE